MMDMGHISTVNQQETYLPNVARYPGARVHDGEAVIVENSTYGESGYDMLFDTTLKVLRIYLLDKNADLRATELALKKFKRGFQELQSADRINVQTLTEIVSKSIEVVAARSRVQK